MKPLGLWRGASAVGAGFALPLLVGCAVGPDYVPPEAETPDLWHQELVQGLREGEGDLSAWWTELGDPMLTSLIERATEGNLDLRLAVARVDEARALRGIARGEWFPFLGGIADAFRTRASEKVIGAIPPPRTRSDNFFSVGLDSSWELDLWGRIRRSVESADAGLMASVENYRDTLVVLHAEVGLAYVDTRTLQDRLRYALLNVDTQQGTLQLTRERNAAGLVSDLDVRQAEENLASTEAFVPVLRQLLARAIHRLGVLLGQAPATLHAELAPEAPIPAPPAETLIGLPTELLRQRPDIRRAERELAAQTARIGVATAELYPRLSLVGAFAFEGLRGNDLLGSANRAFVFGPTVSWNLFDGGRVRANIRGEEARTEQALVLYEQTVLRALEEVENALVEHAEEGERRDALERSANAAAAAVGLVDTLYRTGLTDFQNVLDTQRSQFVRQDELAASTGAVTQDLIRIYKALGGGWDPAMLPPLPDP